MINIGVCCSDHDPDCLQRLVKRLTIHQRAHRRCKASRWRQQRKVLIRKRAGFGNSAAAVFAGNELLGRPFSKSELVPFAMEGERATSGKAHADNVAPSLLGGFTLVRSYAPLDVVSLSFPAELYVTVVHPQIEVKTADSKRMLKAEVSMDKAIGQWGNVAGLVAGLATNDFDLISRSLEDHIVEPVRSVLIPGYDGAKESALQAGALGCNISGSGPSLFALCKGRNAARLVSDAFTQYFEKLDIDHHVYVSGISKTGARSVAAPVNNVQPQPQQS